MSSRKRKPLGVVRGHRGVPFVERCSLEDGHPREDNGWRRRARPAREFLVPLQSVYQMGKTSRGVKSVLKNKDFYGFIG